MNSRIFIVFLCTFSQILAAPDGHKIIKFPDPKIVRRYVLRSEGKIN